jgi:PAS domain S-box-containing protein
MDKTIMNVNTAFLEYMGFHRKEVIGHSAQEFNVVSALREENVRNTEQEITLPDGGKRTILTSTQRICVENTDAILSTFIDITERVRTERQVRILNIERASAELSERHRIARLLHDDLQQRIFAIKMHLERLKENYINKNADLAKEDFARLDVWLAEAIAMTRKLSSDISPLSVSGSTLPEIILWLAAEMKEQYRLETQFEGSDIQPEIHSEMLSVLLQALRELLFNIVKNAGTKEAVVKLETGTDQSIRILVIDSGKGFDMEEMRKKETIGGGLANVRHQLSMFGCTLEIDSTPGIGTCAIIGVPLPNPESRP